MLDPGVRRVLEAPGRVALNPVDDPATYDDGLKSASWP
jgi:hypothetical protein